MTYTDLIDRFGTASEAARKLRVTRAAVSYWRTHGIPKGRQALIQIQTRGRLRADDPRAVPQ